MPGSMPLAASKRTTRVTVQRLNRTSATDGGGHVNESVDANWETATDVGTSGKLWVSLIPRSSREFFRGEQVAADITHQAEVLFQAGKRITDKMRMVLPGPNGTRTLNVAEPPVDVDEEHHSLRFACIEVVEG